MEILKKYAKQILTSNGQIEMTNHGKLGDGFVICYDDAHDSR